MLVPRMILAFTCHRITCLRPRLALRTNTSLPDVLLLSVLHDDDCARQWHRVLRVRGADDDTEGAFLSHPLKIHPVIISVSYVSSKRNVDIGV